MFYHKVVYDTFCTIHILPSYTVVTQLNHLKHFQKTNYKRLFLNVECTLHAIFKYHKYHLNAILPLIQLPSQQVLRLHCFISTA